MERNEIARITGEKLKELRGVRTRVGVARELGISPTKLANYEHAYGIPPDAMKVKLARYYGTTVEELFFDQQYQEV